MTSLPIRSLTLYKQGIGVFQRRATVNTSALTLSVPRASLNDVLKSLDIVIHQGGPMQSVDYDTPADKADLLVNHV